MDDFNQTSLFPKTEKELEMEREEAFLGQALPALREAAKSRNANPEDITYKVSSTYSSLKFRSSLICRLKLRGKKWYIAIPERLQEVIPEGVETTTISSEKQFLRIAFDLLTESGVLSLMEKATLLAIELVPKEFDCCSRYEECSDAKVCIHPDPAFSMLCGYRKILKSGRIFYGENRNID